MGMIASRRTATTAMARAAIVAAWGDNQGAAGFPIGVLDMLTLGHVGKYKVPAASSPSRGADVPPCRAQESLRGAAASQTAPTAAWRPRPAGTWRCYGRG